MLLRRRGFLLASAAGLAALVSRPAAASVARALTLTELVRASERAVVVTALEANSRWATVGGRRRIVTDTRLRVERALGGPDDATELLVQTLGGQVGDVGQVVHGEALLLVGETALLFVTSGPDGQLLVTGMAQGHFPVRTGSDGEKRLRRSPRVAELHGSGSAAEQLEGRRLEEASELVRKAWRDAR